MESKKGKLSTLSLFTWKVSFCGESVLFKSWNKKDDLRSACVFCLLDTSTSCTLITSFRFLCLKIHCVDVIDEEGHWQHKYCIFHESQIQTGKAGVVLFHRIDPLCVSSVTVGTAAYGNFMAEKVNICRQALSNKEYSAVLCLRCRVESSGQTVGRAKQTGDCDLDSLSAGIRSLGKPRTRYRWWNTEIKRKNFSFHSEVYWFMALDCQG